VEKLILDLDTHSDQSPACTYQLDLNFKYINLDVRLSDLDSINMKYVRNCISPADNRYSASASVINDLLLVKSKLADVSVLSSTDVDFIIDTLCVS